MTFPHIPTPTDAATRAIDLEIPTITPEILAEAQARAARLRSEAIHAALGAAAARVRQAFAAAALRPAPARAAQPC